jgi:hypothetical protein
MIAAVMFAVSVHIAGVHKFHPKDMEVVEFLGMWLPWLFVKTLMTALALFAVSYLISMLTSEVVAILTSCFLVYFVCPQSLYMFHIGGYYLEVMTDFETAQRIVFCVLTVLGIFGSIGLSLGNMRVPLRRRLVVLGFSFVYGLATLSVVTAVYLTLATRSPYALVDAACFFGSLADVKHYGPQYYWAQKSHVVSPDGRRVAYLQQPPMDEPGPQTRMEVRMSDEHGDRSVLTRTRVGPLAWYPCGDLLLMAGDTGRMIELVRWDHTKNRITKLADFECNAQGEQKFDALPNPDGTKVALFVTPPGTSGEDLWMLDLQSGVCRIVRPDIQSPRAKTPAVWLGDKLILPGQGADSWSIRADGSDWTHIDNRRRILKND